VGDPAVSEPVLLSVEDLRVEDAADSVSFKLAAGGGLALIGGDASQLALAPLRLTRPPSGRIVFAGRDLLALDGSELRTILGSEIAAVFADAADSLHPSYKLGWQLAEAVRAHHRVSKSAARDRAADALEAVGVPDPRRAVNVYPRALPADVRLRAAIAIALINGPRLLLVDDPFAARKVVTRAAIIEVLRDLRRRLGFGLLLATADADLARQLADEVYSPSGSASSPSSPSSSPSSSST
jgi:ABC-type microcin C transport system duplicated ATPase subunit YejF